MKKKYQNLTRDNYAWLRKMIKIMKLTICLLLISSMFVSAKSFSQGAKLNLDYQQISIAELFKIIEEQSDYRFAYSQSRLNPEEKISIDVKNENLEQVLKTVLNQDKLSYTIIDRYVVISDRQSSDMLIRYGQQQKISGKVADSQGQPLPGVTVVVKGSAQGTITDTDGNYSISNVPENGTLVFTFVGMKMQEILVSKRTVINVTLQEETIGLDEVVAIGYGSVKKSELTGSVSKISANSIDERPLTRVDQALVGQMTGVVARTVSGEPGKALEIRIRGGSSITASNDPLYVIDGMPIDNLNDINPDDIESIEVLKDAASSAIYGSRGSNGVVIITTKKGKAGKAKFQFSAYYGLQKPEKKLDLLSSEEWIDMATELINKKWEAKADGNSASDSYAVRAAALGITDITDYTLANPSYMLDPRWEYGTDSLAFIDWQDEFYRTAPIRNYQMSASGGSKDVSYMISGGWFQQDGIAIETGYKRMNLRSNLVAQMNDKLKVEFSIAPTFAWKNGYSIEGKDGISHKLLSMCPVAEKDAGVYTNIYDNEKYTWASSSVSPVGYMESVTDNTERFKLLSNLSITYTILKGLNIKASGAWTNEGYSQKRYIPTYDYDNEEGSTSSAFKDTRRSNTFLGEGLLTFNRTFGDHSFSAIAGYSVEYYKYDRQYNANKGFANDDLETFTYAGSTSVTNSYISETERMLISYLSRVTYSYKEKYLLSGSIRRDGSSKFGWSNLWGIFPSLSAGWKMDKENFMKTLPWISNLKLRYSWGKNGNNSIDDYEAFGSMSTGVYSFGGETVSASQPSSMTNTELKWEKTSSSNFGIDLGVLNDRISLTADYYYKKTTDLLLDEPLPYVTGFTSSLQNVGSVENKGLEFELTSHNITGKFSWYTTANLSFNKNKVLKLGADGEPIYSGWSDETNIIQEGKPLNSFYLYEAIGILSQADIDNDEVAKTSGAKEGDIRYLDYDGSGSIDEDDIHIVGKPNPDYIWGITNTFSFLNFDLSILFQGQHGGNSLALLGRAIDRPGMGVTSNALGRWRNRWRSEDEPGDGHTPRIDGTTGTRLDTRWLYDASYIKLKNLTLGYNLPKKINRKIGIDQARFYISLENLWRHDHYYGGFSPEASNTDGTDYGAYPAAKTYTLGVNLNF